MTPDQALANGDIDLNAYQHEPFLDNFNEKNGTRLVSIGKTILSPLAFTPESIKQPDKFLTAPLSPFPMILPMAGVPFSLLDFQRLEFN